MYFLARQRDTIARTLEPTKSQDSRNVYGPQKDHRPNCPVRPSSRFRHRSCNSRTYHRRCPLGFDPPIGLPTLEHVDPPHPDAAVKPWEVTDRRPGLCCSETALLRPPLRTLPTYRKMWSWSRPSDVTTFDQRFQEHFHVFTKKKAHRVIYNLSMDVLGYILVQNICSE